jgi:hypothetical protein
MESTNRRKVCIFGTLHDYQTSVVRPQFFQNIKDLMDIHSVDLVAEEASGCPGTYANALVELCKKMKPNITLDWKQVDLTGPERVGIPDKNPSGNGTFHDLDFQIVREWTWVARTLMAMETSALLICGVAHTFSVGEKFRFAGLEVETHVYFDRRDMDAIRKTPGQGQAI